MPTDKMFEELVDRATSPIEELVSNTPVNPAEPINKTPKIRLDYADTILDRDWMTRAFMVSDNDLPSDLDKANRYWSSASVKYTDTRMGGNIGINARPQYTRYADPRNPGRRSDRTPVSVTSTGNHGMGRYYSEAEDDASQTIYMRFGVPEFNSLGRFLSLAIDPNVSSLARTGQGKSIFYDAAKVIGTIATVVHFPIAAAVIFLGSAVGGLLGIPSSKFYYMKPTMHLYWSSVNHILTTIAVNLGVVPTTLAKREDSRLGSFIKVDNTLMRELQVLMPDIITDDNYIDVYAIANRASRLAKAQFMSEYHQFNDQSSTDFTGYLKKSYTDKLVKPAGDHSFSNFLQRVVTFGDYSSTNGPEGGTSDTLLSNSSAKTKTIQLVEGDETTNVETIDTSWLSEAKTFFDAEIMDGSQFAIFKVDDIGAVDTSFNTTTRENSMAGTINEKSSSSRSLTFSLSGGNLGDNVVADTAEALLKATKDVVTGGLDGITLGFSNVLTALAGGGYVDIPKEYENSSASLPRITYSTTLISPYNTPLAQIQNMYLPLSMFIAATLPLATGKLSYTSPFLCSIFHRGRQHSKLSIVESLTISAGKSNLSFTKTGRPLSIEVTFTVVSLDSVMYMPIDTGGVFGTDMALDPDNIFSTFLATLTGMDLSSEHYMFSRLKLNAAKKLAHLQQLKSPAYWANVMGESTVGEMLSTLAPINPFTRDSTGL